MSDTSKATPKWAVIEAGAGYLRWNVRRDGEEKATAIWLTKERAHLVCNALNSYNPDRDKLARGLAISLLNGACPCLCRACGHSVRLARRLLKLYEEE